MIVTTATIADIDIAPLFAADRDRRLACARRIAAACERSGFVRVTGHGVPPAVPQDALAQARAFFAQDEAAKRRLTRPPGTLRGYVPIMPFARQRHRGAPRTIYEAFLVGEEADMTEPAISRAIPQADRGLAAPNRWPPAPPGFRAAIGACYGAFSTLATALLRAFALAMEREEDALTRLFVRPLSNLSLLHYPARPQAEGAPGDDVFPHRDTNAVTVLLPGEVGGLQVQNPQGGWSEVDHRPGTLIVNIGNMMESWSGGRFRSTMHRVHPPRRRERFSIAFFAVPSYATVVAPLPGLPVTGAPDDMAPRHAGRDLAAFVANFDAQVPTRPRAPPDMPEQGQAAVTAPGR